MTKADMKTPIECFIIAMPFHADAAAHDELGQKVNEQSGTGCELLRTSFLTNPLAQSRARSDYSLESSNEAR